MPIRPCGAPTHAVSPWGTDRRWFSNRTSWRADRLVRSGDSQKRPLKINRWCSDEGIMVGMDGTEPAAGVPDAALLAELQGVQRGILDKLGELSRLPPSVFGSQIIAFHAKALLPTTIGIPDLDSLYGAVRRELSRRWIETDYRETWVGHVLLSLADEILQAERLVEQLGIEELEFGAAFLTPPTQLYRFFASEPIEASHAADGSLHPLLPIAEGHADGRSWALSGEQDWDSASTVLDETLNAVGPPPGWTGPRRHFMPLIPSPAGMR